MCASLRYLVAQSCACAARQACGQHTWCMKHNKQFSNTYRFTISCSAPKSVLLTVTGAVVVAAALASSGWRLRWRCLVARPAVLLFAQRRGFDILLAIGECRLCSVRISKRTADQVLDSGRMSEQGRLADVDRQSTAQSVQLKGLNAAQTNMLFGLNQSTCIPLPNDTASAGG